MKSTHERESNFELMRIISMFMIILWHIIIHGKLITMSTGATNLLYNFLLALFVVHVNSFVLVTGYFQSKSKFSLKKFLRLFLLVWFYRVIILLFLTQFKFIKLAPIDFIIDLFPIGSGKYWFINCYLIIYLLSPFINKLIENLKHNEYRKLLLISFLIFSIIPFITNNVTVSNNGYTIIQFCYLYLLGAYFRKYPIKDNYHFKIYSREKRQLVFLFGFIFCAIANFVIIIFAKQLNNCINPVVNLFSKYIMNSQYNYSTPIDIIQSICYFLYFETLTIKNRFINKVASIILGVYLIHDNDLIRLILYKKLRIDNGMMKGPRSIIYMFLCAILIFTVCLLIEYTRNLITKFINNRKIVKKEKERFYNYISRI